MYSVGTAYILWFFSGCGILGLHRFYLGKIPSGILWMCTGGLFGFGSLYDFLTLSRQVREANMHRAMYGGASGQFNDGQERVVRKKESVERIILRVAKKNKGIITAGEIALAADISIEEAKRGLEALVSRGFAELRVRRSGALVYTIPDLMDSEEPLENL